MRPFTSALALSLCLFAGLFGSSAHAAWPDKPIRMIVPFATGGSATSAAREIAQRMSQRLGQNVYVDNLGGAGGNIGAAAGANAEPDGYTVLVASSGILTVNPYLYKKLPFNPDGFKPVGMMAAYPLVVFTNARLPFRDLPGLIQFARQNPGKVTFGSAGYGSSGHLFGELLKDAAKIDMVHVAYKGGSQAMMDVIGGQISMMMEASVVGIGQVQQGSLRAIGVTGPSRLAAMPDVPTVAEAGLAGFDAVGWYALLVPAATPDAVVTRLNAALNDALNDHELRDKLTAMGMTALPGAPQALTTTMTRDRAKWSAVVRKGGLTLD